MQRLSRLYQPRATRAYREWQPAAQWRRCRRSEPSRGTGHGAGLRGSSDGARAGGDRQQQPSMPGRGAEGRPGERTRCAPLQLKNFRDVVQVARTKPLNPNQLVISLKDSRNVAGIVREVTNAMGWREATCFAEECNANLYWYERAISVGEVKLLNERQRVNMIPGMHDIAKKVPLTPHGKPSPGRPLPPPPLGDPPSHAWTPPH